MRVNSTVGRQMVGAELMRLYRKRGLMALVAVIMVVPLAIGVAYWVAAHASNPHTWPPVGGVKGFTKMIDLLGVYVGPVAAVLIGAEAGAGDLAAGVFREHVMTGRSRLALFLAKVPAVLALTVAASAAGFGIAAGAGVVFTGGLKAPDLALLLQGAGWLALSTGVVGIVALGLGALTGSRPGTIAGLIGWELVLSPLVVQANSLGHVRDGLLDGVMTFLRPGAAIGGGSLTMPVAVAVAVIAAWLLVLPAAGGWRALTRDA
jgi:hypothetical protein